MTKLITTVAIAVGILATGAAANATPKYGNALREIAATHGSFTPHGVWDAQ